MDNLDLSKLTSEQEHVLGNAYRFIKEQATWLRMKKKSTAENTGSKNHASATNSDIITEQSS